MFVLAVVFNTARQLFTSYQELIIRSGLKETGRGTQVNTDTVAFYLRHGISLLLLQGSWILEFVSQSTCVMGIELQSFAKSNMLFDL